MPRREWSCTKCKEPLGHITVDRYGDEHLKAYAEQVTRLDPVVPGESTIVYCQCGEWRVFHGVAVHLEAKKAA